MFDASTENQPISARHRRCSIAPRQMASEISIVVADVSRASAIRDRVQLPGRAIDFTSGNLGSAMESIRAYRPKVVAVDALFAQMPAGVAFIDRVDALALPGTA